MTLSFYSVPTGSMSRLAGSTTGSTGSSNTWEDKKEPVTGSQQQPQSRGEEEEDPEGSSSSRGPQSAETTWDWKPDPADDCQGDTKHTLTHFHDLKRHCTDLVNLLQTDFKSDFQRLCLLQCCSCWWWRLTPIPTHQDIRQQRLHRQRRGVELLKLRETLNSLQVKSSFHSEQVDYYRHYITSCLDNLTTNRYRWTILCSQYLLVFTETKTLTCCVAVNLPIRKQQRAKQGRRFLLWVTVPPAFTRKEFC